MYRICRELQYLTQTW